MNCIRSLILVSVLFISFCHDAYSQEENDEGLTYHIDRQITFGHGQNPLWLNANKYGLSSIKDDNGFIKGGITGQTVLGNSGDWWLKYGADLAVAYNFSSTLIIQQLYGDLQFRKLTLSVGSKQRKAQLKNNELSSGGQTFGINARPIPEISLETPEYVNILKDNNLIGLKFRFGYGMTTDWRWQRHFAAEDTRYTSRHWLHNQALYLRVGDEERFPLVYEGGFEWSNQFGGTIHNYNQTDLKRIKMHQRFKDFFKAIYAGGSDPTDAGYDNAQGNTVGSWLMSLSYKLPNEAKVRLYFDHYFEDHSQLFLQYGWKDGLLGGEITLPKNRIATSLVYEYIHTTDQSGPIYHDHTEAVSDQISAVDNYYNHNLYTGWQHWGQAIGNPLYIAQLYNKNLRLNFANNRFIAHHVGLAGDPMKELHYRLLYTYSTNLGTYQHPFDDKKYNTSFLAELTYSPTHIGSWDTRGNSIRLGFGFDRGNLIGNNTGFQLTFCSKGWLKH